MKCVIPIVALLSLAAGCTHEESVGTTTIRSGTPDGPRVTDFRPAASASEAPTEPPPCPIGKSCPPGR